jgi:hypothetical protein
MQWDVDQQIFTKFENANKKINKLFLYKYSLFHLGKSRSAIIEKTLKIRLTMSSNSKYVFTYTGTLKDSNKVSSNGQIMLSNLAFTGPSFF